MEDTRDTVIEDERLGDSLITQRWKSEREQVFTSQEPNTMSASKDTRHPLGRGSRD